MPKLPTPGFVRKYRDWRYGKHAVFAINIPSSGRLASWHCPYCATTTQSGDHTCTGCGAVYDEDSGRVQRPVKLQK